MSESDAATAQDWLDRAIEQEKKGGYFAAHDIAAHGLEHFPNDPWLAHRAVLALARSGATERAWDKYRDYKLDARSEEDIVALGARIAKDFALNASGVERRMRAAEAGRGYEAAFEASGGYYSAINAATIWLLAGDGERSRTLAAKALEICARTKPEDDHPYYLAATEAEANILLGREDAAKAALERAFARNDGDFAAMATTRRQLRLACEAVGIDDAVLDVLAPPTVVHYSGHMIGARFPESEVPDAARRIGDALERHGAGFGYGSLACGADILFAEALLARGAELHLVFPFEIAEFKAVSVDRGEEGWSGRFDHCLARAASVTMATDDAYLGDDYLFAYAANLAMGLALLRAASLEAPAHQVALWDGQGAGGDAGTAVDVAFWRARGLESDVIDVPPLPVAPSPPASGDKASRRVARAMLFGDMKGFSKLTDPQIVLYAEHVLGLFGDVLARHGESVLHRNTWGDGLYLVLGDAPEAARLALDLQAAVGDMDFEAIGLPPGFSLRLGGHLGPVFPMIDKVSGNENFFGAHVSRTARVEPVTPPGYVYVTEPFAARLALESGSEFRCEYVGHMDAAKGYGRMRMYLLREAKPRN